MWRPKQTLVANEHAKGKQVGLSNTLQYLRRSPCQATPDEPPLAADMLSLYLLPIFFILRELPGTPVIWKVAA